MPDHHSLSETERATQERVGHLAIDVPAMQAVLSIYRAANASRSRLTNTVLRPHDLTWTGFLVLWLLWIWERMETRRVAESVGISKATLTGVANTLEGRGLVTRIPSTTDRRLVDLERLCRAYPVVPGPALWATFQALDPVGIPRKYRRAGERWRDREQRERFRAQEAWLNDPVPMTARVLRDVVDGLYRKNLLAKGELRVAGRPVALARGTQPVLNLIASSDSLVPPACARPLADLWGGPVTTREFAAGHIGVTVGSRAPRDLWATVAQWLRAHQPTKELPS